MNVDEKKLIERLNFLEITHQLYRHPPLFTVAESQAFRGNLVGGHYKNLFVKDKKGKFGLMVVNESVETNLKSCAKPLGFGRLSFASADKMRAILGVSPGSVTPFALMNYPHHENNDPVLNIILDQDIMNHTLIHFHPLHNEATLALSPLDLLKFIAHLNYEPVFYGF